MLDGSINTPKTLGGLTAQEWSEYDVLADTLGTGRGLQRVPSRTATAASMGSRPFDRKLPGQWVYGERDIIQTSLTGTTVWIVGVALGGCVQRLYRIDVPEGLGDPMQCDMGAYRFMARRKEELDFKRKVFSGWRPPSRFMPSPFGPDRHRVFDSVGQFDHIANENGIIRHHAYA